MLVRPEELLLQPLTDGSPGTDDDGLEAQVELVEFVGHDTTYLVRAGELSLQVRRASMPVVARGDLVRVRYAGEAAAWFTPE